MLPRLHPTAFVAFLLLLPLVSSTPTTTLSSVMPSFDVTDLGAAFSAVTGAVNHNRPVLSFSEYERNQPDKMNPPNMLPSCVTLSNTGTDFSGDATFASYDSFESFTTSQSHSLGLGGSMLGFLSGSFNMQSTRTESFSRLQQSRLFASDMSGTFAKAMIPHHALMGVPFSREFSDALSTADTQAAFNKVFNQFGTHVVTGFWYGGKRHLTVAIKDCLAQHGGDSERTLELGLKFALFKSAHIEMDPEMASEAKTAYEKIQGAISMKIDGGQLGGDVNGSSSAAEWWNSVKSNPAIVQPVLTSLADLFSTDNPMHDRLSAALTTYYSSVPTGSNGEVCSGVGRADYLAQTCSCDSSHGYGAYYSGDACETPIMRSLQLSFSSGNNIPDEDGWFNNGDNYVKITSGSESWSTNTDEGCAHTCSWDPTPKDIGIFSVHGTPNIVVELWDEDGCCQGDGDDDFISSLTFDVAKHCAWGTTTPFTLGVDDSGICSSSTWTSGSSSPRVHGSCSFQ